jgi:hypothetical protein
MTLAGCAASPDDRDALWERALSYAQKCSLLHQDVDGIDVRLAVKRWVFLQPLVCEQSHTNGCFLLTSRVRAAEALIKLARYAEARQACADARQVGGTVSMPAELGAIETEAGENEDMLKQAQHIRTQHGIMQSMFGKMGDIMGLDFQADLVSARREPEVEGGLASTWNAVGLPSLEFLPEVGRHGEDFEPYCALPDGLDVINVSIPVVEERKSRASKTPQKGGRAARFGSKSGQKGDRKKVSKLIMFTFVAVLRRKDAPAERHRCRFQYSELSPVYITAAPRTEGWEARALAAAHDDIVRTANEKARSSMLEPPSQVADSGRRTRKPASKGVPEEDAQTHVGDAGGGYVYIHNFYGGICDCTDTPLELASAMHSGNVTALSQGGQRVVGAHLGTSVKLVLPEEFRDLIQKMTQDAILTPALLDMSLTTGVQNLKAALAARLGSGNALRQFMQALLTSGDAQSETDGQYAYLLLCAAVCVHPGGEQLLTQLTNRRLWWGGSDEDGGQVNDALRRLAEQEEIETLVIAREARSARTMLALLRDLVILLYFQGLLYPEIVKLAADQYDPGTLPFLLCSGSMEFLLCIGANGTSRCEGMNLENIKPSGKGGQKLCSAEMTNQVFYRKELWGEGGLIERCVSDQRWPE